MPRWLQKLSRRVRWLVPLAAVMLACNAPFIPVPPPQNVFVQETLTDGTGQSHIVWITEGKPDERAAGARFSIFNDANKRGVLVDANSDGTYVAPALEGAMGDHVFVSYTTLSGMVSEVACRVLQE